MTHDSPRAHDSSDIRQRRVRRAQLVAAVVVCLGLLASIYIWNFTRQTIAHKEKARFDHYAEMMTATIVERLNENLAALRGLRAFVDSSDKVSGDEWDRYVGELGIGNLHGVVGLALARQVRRDRLDQFLAEVRAEGAMDFRVATAGEDPLLAVVEFIQPFFSNVELSGYDLRQLPVYRQALVDSAVLDRPVMSGKAVIRQQGEEFPGCLIALPIYRQAVSIAPSEDHRGEIRGWAVALVRFDQLLENIVGYLDKPLDIEIFDESSAGAATLLYDDDKLLRSMGGGPDDFEMISGSSLEVAGRRWNVQILALEGFFRPIEQYFPFAFLLAGILLSVFAALRVTSSARMLREAELLAEQMTAGLRESEQRFKGMFRNHATVMLLVEPDQGIILDANDAACRFYGYSLNQLRGMPLADINVLSGDEIRVARRKIIAREESSFEFQHRLASGELRDVQVHSSPIEVNQQTVLFSIIHDITPKKRAEQALAESENKYRVLFEGAAHGAAVADAETGVILACNRQLARMVGREVEEIVGKPQRILHPPQPEGNGLTASFRQHRNGNHARLIEDQLLRSDGQLVPVEIKTSRLTIGGREVLNGFFYDITDQKRAEMALRASEERFRQVFVMNPDPVILARFHDGSILDVNRAFESATGITRMEALGHNSEELGLWSNPEIRSSLRNQLQQDGEVSNLEAEFRVAKGEAKVGLVSARILDIHNEPCILVVIRDITTEKEAERALVAMDRMKNEFISTAAHELRTPLSAMMGFTELLRLPGSGEFSEQQRRDFLDEVYDRGEALSRIIDDLLDISRIESGHPITLSRQPTDLKELLGRAVEFHRLHDRGRLFRLDLPDLPGEIQILVDRQRINQVIENLLSNAVKYSPPNEEILLRLGGVDGGWEVRVIDRGIGMSPDQLSRVFDKFYRADASNTAIGGLGLGMSIAKQIIDAHGGRIWVESRLGAGTCAVFFLPDAEPGWGMSSAPAND